MFRCGNKFDQKNKIQISDSDMEAFCEQCHNLVSGKIFFILMKFKPDPYFQAFIRLHVRQGKGWRRCSWTLPSSWPTPTGPGWSYRQQRRTVSMCREEILMYHVTWHLELPVMDARARVTSVVSRVPRSLPVTMYLFPFPVTDCYRCN